jgi:hypothetical protein
MRWRLNENGVFNVRSYYTAIRGTNDVPFSWKSIWCVIAPKRVSFFVWTTAWEKILTCGNLIKRGFTIVGWCCTCQCNGDTVDYLLIHCDVFISYVDFFFESIWDQWVLPERVMDLLFGWRNWFAKHSSNIGNLVPSCLICTLWRERNHHSLEDAEISVIQLKSPLEYRCIIGLVCWVSPIAISLETL